MNARATMTEFLGLRSRITGEIARVRSQDGDTTQNCSLCKDPSFPYFKAESETQLQRVLLSCTPWYNATVDEPGWGDFDGPDLVPVKVRVSVEFEEVTLPPMVSVQTLDTREIHAKVARGYAGRELVTDGEGRILFWLVYRPDGLSLEDMRAWVGQHVFSNKDAWTRRKVYAVCEVPEEFVPEFAGRPGALLLASENRYD